MRSGLGGGRATAEGLIESGTALIGSPETVLAGVERMRERTGFGILVALLHFGVLSDDLTRRNMNLFAAEVMPHLRGWGAASYRGLYLFVSPIERRSRTPLSAINEIRRARMHRSHRRRGTEGSNPPSSSREMVWGRRRRRWHHS